MNLTGMTDIYATHWSTGERKIIHDLPDIRIPKDQFKK